MPPSPGGAFRSTEEGAGSTLRSPRPGLTRTWTVCRPVHAPLVVPWEPRGHAGTPNFRPSDVDSGPGSEREMQGSEHWMGDPDLLSSLHLPSWPASPTHLAHHWGNPGLEPHCMEELRLQRQELLVEVWPVLLAQQELEDALLGRGVVLLHVGGDVAVTGKDGKLACPLSHGCQPQVGQEGEIT